MDIIISTNYYNFYLSYESGELMSFFLNTALSSAILNNKLAFAVFPTVAVGTISMSARVTLGALSIGFKGLAELFGHIDREVSEDLKDFGKTLMSYAKKNYSLELKATVGLTAAMIGGIGITMIFAKPEVPVSKSCVNLVKDTINQSSLYLPQCPVPIKVASQPSGENITNSTYWMNDAFYWFVKNILPIEV